MLTVRNGDLLTATEHFIAHQVNCRGVMGAGLAKQIKQQHPQVFLKYQRACQVTNKPSDLLGKIQTIAVSPTQTIVNIFGQINYGTSQVQTSVPALRRAFITLASTAASKDESYHTIALPYGIGCGLAGGNWQTVYTVLTEVFEELYPQISCVLYKR